MLHTHSVACKFVHYYMILLIDYDNLPRPLMNRNLRQIIDVLLSKLDYSTTTLVNRVSCRLYGGWFKRNLLSQKAQQLSGQIEQYFPLTLSPSGQTNVIVEVELARALACDPGYNFSHTFRIRSKPEFRVKHFPLKECVEPMNCRIMNVNSFVYNNICPEVHCNVSPETAFYKAEQKLVDSMIVVDLIHYAMNENDRLVVVSGDDDMWPGIRYALLQKAKIIHMTPRLPKLRKNPYKQFYTKNYTSIIF